MNQTFKNLLRAAALRTPAGPLTQATAAIQRALGGAAAQASIKSAQRHVPPFVPPYVNAIRMGMPKTWPVRPVPSTAEPGGDVFEAGLPSAVADVDQRGGEFRSGTHSHASLTRNYKLFIPPGHAGQSLPLVVMLHGCTQDPDDFAAGTGMNDAAREQGFFVLYPAQAQDANPSRCWNWFKHNHQRRDSGEPAVLADMARMVIEQYGIDARRVYIAGLSAGGAMAAIVAGLYPELFAALGVHSGLPSGSASNVAEALAVMKSGAGGAADPLWRPGRPRPASIHVSRRPTIVFHGDRDQTVHPRNGEQIIEATVGDNAAAPEAEHGASAMGRRYTRTIHRGGDGQTLAEHWLIHGAGHAWSGGLAKGSYTDSTGPDASREMLRFFFAQANGLRH